MSVRDLPGSIDPAKIYALYSGGFKARISRIALEIDLFSPLAMGPLDAGQVADACKTDLIATQALLDYMAAIGILTHEAGRYGLTPSAEAFLVRGRQTYAGDWLLMETDSDLWKNVLAAVRTGRHRVGELPAAQDAWLESHSLTRIEQSLEMWTTIGVDQRKHDDLRILDVGCGCGIKTFALARESPNVHITCVDSPSVLAVARQLADRLGILAQTTFKPGDLKEADLGTESFDLVFLGQITYSLTQSENLELFRRAYRALVSGGMLVIDAIMRTEDPSESASVVTLLMRSLTGGAAHSASEYETWLRAGGFHNLVVHSEKWLSATRP
jgi:ubiquinone/menaquinone biosynthesis C-methylase UbiE